MSSGTMKFNGYLRVRIGEAVGLQPTRWSLRHSLFKKGYQLLDPYLTVSVDQVRVGQTSTKQKTNKPTYNEEFCANVTDGGHLELAVFHETPLGYDHFVANCTLQFQELLRTAGASDTFEGWVLSFPLLCDEMIIIMKWSGLAKWSKPFEESREFNDLNSGELIEENFFNVVKDNCEKPTAPQAQAKARTAFSTWEKVEVPYLGRQVVQGRLAPGQVDAVHFIPLLLNTYSKQLVLQKAFPPPHSNDCI
ncbi:PREDICTED: protein kinase C epsilon type-like [Lipotes vexillifer]|uniref:Protein kinase C epsilon type-like n=1 Tax=Lipotes vexillifer TaxID=118797 RepID=A0A340YJE7_LIPVE|nr:PREDICTED: protein kinase C epsilon type-like [Lipotes vexillifer]